MPDLDEMAPAFGEFVQVIVGDRTSQSKDATWELLKGMSKSGRPGRGWVLSEKAGNPAGLHGVSLVLRMEDAQAPLAAREETKVTVGSKA